MAKESFKTVAKKELESSVIIELFFSVTDIVLNTQACRSNVKTQSNWSSRGDKPEGRVIHRKMSSPQPANNTHRSSKATYLLSQPLKSIRMIARICA